MSGEELGPIQHGRMDKHSQGGMVLHITISKAMKIFKGGNRHLKFDTEGNWEPL